MTIIIGNENGVTTNVKKMDEKQKKGKPLTRSGKTRLSNIELSESSNSNNANKRNSRGGRKSNKSSNLEMAMDSISPTKKDKRLVNVPMKIF